MEIIKYSKIYFTLSIILIITSIVSLFVFGLNFGIDFTGGTILELEYQNERPTNIEIKETLKDLELEEIFVQPTKERNVIIKMKDISEDTHQKILQKLQNVNELRFESIGPTIGNELKQKTKKVIFFSIVVMVLYIIFAFRQVSRSVKPWKYGFVVLVILSHDVLLILGFFSILNKLYGTQITIPVIVALLTVIGYAINNIVIVFDRIRENILKRVGSFFEETVNIAINQTLSRQVNTALTTLFPLLFIFFVGGDTLKYFSLALIAGIFFGTYSSIFLAGPLLSFLQKKRI